MAAEPSDYHRPLPLSAAQLEAACRPDAFRHATRYARSAHLVERLRVGQSISARFHGTRGIYTSRIDLSGREFRFECTCPLYNSRQPCKHVIALGVAWLDTPGTFTDLDLALARLAQMTKADVLTLIRQAANRVPEIIPHLVPRRPR